MAVGAEDDSAGARLRLDAAQAGGHDRAELGAPELKRERAAVDPRQLEQVVDEAGQRAYLLVERRQVVLGPGKAVVDRLEHCLHVRERRAQVVARPGDELPPRLEQPLQALRHLVERVRERAVLGGAALGDADGEVA